MYIKESCITSSNAHTIAIGKYVDVDKSTCLKEKEAKLGDL